MPPASSTSSWHRLDARIERALLARRGHTARDRALADALRTIAAAMRAGASLPQAIERAGSGADGPIAAACRAASAGLSLGRPIDLEIDRFARQVGTPAAGLFAQVVRVQHRRGGDLSAPAHRLAALLHDRIQLDAEARSATAQARFSARAVVAIPVLLAIGAVLRAPDAVRALLHPGPLLLALPGVALIVIGATVAHRVAGRAATIADAHGQARAHSRIRVGITRIAGTGARSRQSARLVVGATVIAAATMAGVGTSPILILCATALLAAAIAWPWTDRARRERERRAVADSGIETLLEVSVALFAAGATAHEVATIAPTRVPDPLRSVLAPAVHGVGLGRSIASAFQPAFEHASSPQLDGWLHAVCSSAELGAPSIDLLEQLLRDARAARREQVRTAAQTAAPRMQLALVLLVVPGVMWLMLLGTMGGLVQQLRAGGVL